jgi:hypothetical protein
MVVRRAERRKSPAAAKRCNELHHPVAFRPDPPLV